MNITNKTTATTTPCPDCPSSSNGGVGVNLGDVVLSDLIINTLNLSLKDPKTLWLNSVATPDELLAISNFLADNNNSVEAINLILNSIDLKLGYTTTNYPGIKIKDSNDNCVCPTGYTEDTSGKCVKQPCSGDPVANPEIAPTLKSDGTYNDGGGRYGYTRSDGSQFHNGIDIKSSEGSNLYSMKGGEVIDRTPASQITSPGTKGAGAFGNTIEIETTLSNGDIIRIKYAHLNTIMAAYGSTIEQGVIIGTTGRTGNASWDNDVIPHVHIKVRKKINGTWKKQNPENYLPTKFNTDGSVNTAINPCN